MTLQLAVIGSGPAGLYCAEKLLRDAPGAAIDVIERLPTPFGLVRAGVAPDHQGTKAVTRIFERLLRREEVGFFGNVAVGEAVSLAELRQLYDAVVIATGALSDRPIGVAGERLEGVWGSAAFVGWYNGLPGHAEPAPALDRVRSAVVIGNGNVAIDVARVLAKTPAEMARSDLDPEAERLIAAAPLAEIWIVGRRGAADAKFSPAELAELGRLARAAPVVDAADLPGDAAADTPVLKVLREFAAAPPAEKPVRIRFRFGYRLERLEGEGRVSDALFRRMTRTPGGWVAAEDLLRLPADLVVGCIGYHSEGCGGLAAPNGIIANDGGRVDDGLYVVGWAKRGPSGTIPTNRSESHAVAQRILAETAPGGRAGRAGLAALLAARGVDAVDWRRWTLIDQHEIAAAGPERVRRKLRSVAAMLRVGSSP